MADSGAIYVAADGSGPMPQQSAQPVMPYQPDPSSGAVYIPATGGESMDVPVQGGYSDIWRSMGTGLKASALGLYGAATGDEDARQAAADAIYHQQLQERRAEAGGVPTQLSDIHSLGDVGRYALAAGMQAAPTMAEYAGAGMLAGAPGMAAVYAARTALDTGEAEAQRAANYKPEDVASSAMWSMPTEALNLLGPGRLIKGGAAGAAADAASQMGAGMLGRTAAGIAGEAAEQGAVGAGQYATGQLAQGDQPTWAGAGEAAAGAAAMSMPFGAFHGVMAKGKDGGQVPVIPDQEQGRFDLMQDTQQKVGQETAPHQMTLDLGTHPTEGTATPWKEGPEPPAPWQGFPRAAEQPAARQGELNLGEPTQHQYGLDLMGGEGTASPLPERGGRPPEPPSRTLPDGRPNPDFDAQFAQYVRDVQGGGPTYGQRQFNLGQRGDTFADQQAIAQLADIARGPTVPPPAAPPAPVARTSAPEPTPATRPLITPPAAPPRPVDLSTLPPRVQDLIQKGLIAERAAARVGPPEPPRVEVPPQIGGGPRGLGVPPEPPGMTPRSPETAANEAAIAAIAKAAGRPLPEAAPPAALARPGPEPAPATQPLQLPQQLARAPGIPANLPPRARAALEAARASAQREAAVGPPEQRVARPAPDIERGFRLQASPPGESWAARERANEMAATGGQQAFALEPSPAGHPGQHELPLEPRAEAVPAPAHPGQRSLLTPVEDASQPWKAILQNAWRESSDGKMTGFGAATRNIMAAENAADAAQRIRDKMQDKSNTPVAKLDAMHRALTGETLDQHMVRTTGEEHATETGKQPEGRRAEREGNGEGGQAAEAGGGRSAEQRGQGETEGTRSPQGTPESRGPEGPAESRGATESERAAEGTARRSAEAEAAREGTGSGEGGGGGGGGGRPAEPRPAAADERGGGAELGTSDGAARAEQPGSPGEPGRLHVDPKEQARAQMPEDIGGPARELSIDGLRQELEKYQNPLLQRRKDAVAELEVIRQLHRDPEYVRMATELLDSHTDPTERRAAQSEVEERAAEINNSQLKGDLLRQGEATTGEHDQQVHDAAAGNGTSARAMLDHIAANHPDPEIRKLAAQLRDRVGEDVTVRHATDAERAAAPANTLAEYRDGEIVLHSPDGAAQSVVHEGVHDATERALDAGGRNAVEMRGLFAEALKHASLMDEYGLKNVHEFVAEAFSNPAFRDKLSAIGGPKGNLWQRFKNAVKRMLGLKVADSLLDRVMESGTKLMGENAGHPAFTHGDGSREALYRQGASGTATGASNAFADFGAGVMKDIRDVKEGRGRETVKNMYIGSMPTHVLVRAYDSLFKGGLKKLAGIMDQRANLIGELGRRAVNTYQRLEGARKKEGNLDRFHDVVSSTQISGVHPKEYDMDKAQAQLAKAQQRMNDVRGMDKSSVAYLTAVGDVRRAQAAVHARDQWEKMTPAGKDALDYMFNQLKESHLMRRDLIKETLGVDAPFLQQTQGPYAPLKRYGDWIVSTRSAEFRNAETALAEANKTGDVHSIAEARQRLALMQKDPSHRTVMGAENALEAKRMVADLKGKLPADTEIHQFTRDEVYNKDTEHRDAMVTDMLKDLEKKFGDGPHMDQIRRVVMDSYMDHLPDGSSAALAAHRQMVSGWSQDFSRAALDRLQRDAFQLGSMRYGLQLHDQLKQLDTMRRENGSVEANKAYTEMARRMSHDMNYNNFTGIENMIHGATHTFYLGASPGFMLMNMMQTPMISVPVMAARHGFGSSIGAAIEGMKAIHTLMRARGGLDLALNALPDPDIHGRISPEAAKQVGLSERQIMMLRTLQNMGLIDLTTAHQSARVARGERNLSPEGAGEQTAAAWNKVKDAVAVPTQYVEALNRAGTGLGAYNLEATRLAKKGGMSADQIHEAATKYAIDVIRDSHVDYSAEANPTFFRAPYMRVALQFKKFGLTMFHMLNQRMVDTFGHRAEIGELNALGDGRTPEQQERLEELMQKRAEGRRALTGLMAMHQLFAGSLGLPFAGAGFAAADLIRGWAGDKEEKYDTKADFQNYLADAFGVPVATAIARGLPAALLGIDMSRRAGMADIVPFSNQIGQSIDSISGGNPNLAEKLLVGVMGPGAGVGEQVVKGFQKFAAGDYAEGVATMMPRAVFNAYQGMKMMGEGIQVGGRTVHEPLNGSDALLGFLGLSTEVSRAKDAAYASKEAETVFSQERMRLVKAAAQARADGESTPDEVAAFNSRNPQGRITMGDVYKYEQTQKGGPKRPTGGGKGAELREIGAEAGRFATEE